MKEEFRGTDEADDHLAERGGAASASTSLLFAICLSNSSPSKRMRGAPGTDGPDKSSRGREGLKRAGRR